MKYRLLYGTSPGGHKQKRDFCIHEIVAAKPSGVTGCQCERE